MKLENTLMKLILGVLLIITHILVKDTYSIVNRPTPNNIGLNHGYYDEWLFVGFIYWLSLTAGSLLLLIGILQLIRDSLNKKEY